MIGEIFTHPGGSMGLYLRKSIRVGPFRFNLSNGGVGVSVGIKGFRVGSGPRGNYVHMGANGIYYRATIPSAIRSNPGGAGSRPLGGPVDPVIPARTHGPMVDIESADSTQIVDSSSRSLLDEMKQKQAKLRVWPWIGAAAVICWWMAWHSGLPTWGVLLVVIVGCSLTAIASFWDTLRKTVVLMYELDPAMEAALTQLHAAADYLTGASAVWHIPSKAQVHDSKYHAGANSLVKRNRTKIHRSAPPFVKTNVQTVAVNVGRQTLHFFPDRLLIYDASGVGAVGYKELQIRTGATSFVEDEAVPSDATVIGHTWRYVNKKGGPDRRFKNNKQIPICNYDQLGLNSSSGLNELLHISRSGSASYISDAVHALARILPAERQA